VEVLLAVEESVALGEPEAVKLTFGVGVMVAEIFAVRVGSTTEAVALGEEDSVFEDPKLRVFVTDTVGVLLTVEEAVMVFEPAMVREPVAEKEADFEEVMVRVPLGEDVPVFEDVEVEVAVGVTFTLDESFGERVMEGQPVEVLEGAKEREPLVEPEGDFVGIVLRE